MSGTTDQYFEYCMSHDIPYFGPHMGAFQGLAIRHAYMQALVAVESRRRPGRSLSILEIGSWAGGSAITWADAIKRHHAGRGSVVCVDPWTPYFDASEAGDLPDPSLYAEMMDALSTGAIFDLFLYNIQAAHLEDIIVPCKGSSARMLPLFGDGVFHLVFVDGVHTCEGVMHDLVQAARLIPAGGILCGDDLETQVGGVDRGYAVFSKNRDYVCDPDTQTWYHPGVSLALDAFFGEVSSWEGFWAMRKEETGWSRVELPERDLEALRIPGHLAHLSRPAPQLIEADYDGYNILQFDHDYYALAHSLGPVDLAREAEAVRAREADGTCVIGRTLEEVKKKLHAPRYTREDEPEPVSL